MARISNVVALSIILSLVIPTVHSAMAADGEAVNLKSTSHTENTVDSKSKTTTISMAWGNSTYTKGTLSGYAYKFSASSSDTVAEAINLQKTATGIDSSSYTGKDGAAYYFYIKAVFTLTEAVGDKGIGEAFWGPQVKKGPYYIDDTAPENPSVAINDDATSTNSPNVTLTIGAANATYMNISNTSYGSGSREDYSTSKAWTLSSTDGNKTVCVQFLDKAGNIIEAKDTIELQTTWLSLSASGATVTKGAALTFTGSGGTTPYAWTVIEEKDTTGSATTAGSVATIAADPLDNTKGILTATGTRTCKVRVADSSATPVSAESTTITVRPPIVLGRVSISIAGHHKLSVSNAFVTIEGTDYRTMTDSDGNFSFEDLPPSSYTLFINAPALVPIRQQFSVTQNQDKIVDIPPMTVLTQEDLNQAVADAVNTERQKWDAGGDNKKGLEEAIGALQVVSGVRSE